jgi:hypothetical protein
VTSNAPVAVTASDTATDTRPGPLSRRIRHGWIVEVLVGVGIYLVYDMLRDQVVGVSADAFRHAQQIVDAEKFLGLYHEYSIQQAFLGVDWFMSFWNIWYGTIHFVMPLVALVWMYRKLPARYVRWRNTLVLMLGVSILVFWAYPLMPPRLMPARFGFVDAAADFFNFGPQVRVHLGANGSAAAVRTYGNLFAAMPSLHVGWSTWSALAVWPLLRRTWAKVLWALYPVSIFFCIVVTANHWILDAVGGWAVLTSGYLGARGIEWLLTRRRIRRHARTAPVPGARTAPPTGGRIR